MAVPMAVPMSLYAIGSAIGTAKNTILVYLYKTIRAHALPLPRQISPYLPSVGQKGQKD